MLVALLIDESEWDDRDPEFRATGARARKMEAFIARALRRNGHRARSLPFLADDPWTTAAALREMKPRVVFNLTEVGTGARWTSCEVPAFLDMLKLRYTGSAALARRLSLDKAFSKEIVSAHGVEIPRFAVYEPKSAIAAPRFGFPAIVKPQFGAGSEGVSSEAVVKSVAELRRRVRYIHTEWGQPAIVEEFVDGVDITVGMIGNGTRKLFPIREVPLPDGAAAPRMLTDTLKASADYRRRWQVKSRNARLRPATRAAVERSAVAACNALQIRDYGRVDFRLTPEGRAVFLEANSNPCLKPTHACVNGPWTSMPFAELIDRIVGYALARSP